jgi:hypothetical protein
MTSLNDNPKRVGGLEMLPIYRPPTDKMPPVDTEPCCGPPAGPPSSPHERPGYELCAYVDGFVETPLGPVPRVRTKLDRKDRLGTLRVRLGAGRSNYRVAPGIYAVGHPNAQSAVLVSANYKLSFDHLREALPGADLWILVLDTRGINVWCAAGKGSFGTQELVERIRVTRLERLVDHRRLMLPQLGAVGVSARTVKKACGFEVVWGPVRAADIKVFMASDHTADTAMRRVTFTLSERLVLIPVELSLMRKPFFWMVALLLVLSGVGPHYFSFAAAWHRGSLAVSAVLTGIIAGCVVVPALLPWLPGRAFALKGAAVGLVLGAMLAGLQWTGSPSPVWAATVLVLLTMAIGSFLAMNFTGATPYTSPTGVEKEMRRFIPLQLAAFVAALGIWVGIAFHV